MRTLALFLALASGSSAQQSSAGNQASIAPAAPVEWKELGPAPIAGANYAGRISALVCSPSNAAVYFAAGADGGVWKTEDGGASWRSLTGRMPTLAMGALALDPNDENVVYAGTGEANYANHSRYGLGLFKSVDGGETWEQLAESVFGGRCFSRIVIDPTNSQRVYASITRAGGFPELAAAKQHPGAMGDLGVFKSEDGGQTWARLTGLPNVSATDLAMDPADSDTLYAGIGRIFGDSQNGIYKTTDGGTNWTKLSGGLPASSDMGRVSLGIAPSTGRIYTLITSISDSFGGNADTLAAMRSDSGGASWSGVGLGNIQATYGWYLSTILVDPTDEDLVFYGGFGLHRSTNGGSSFSTVTPPHVDMHALAWDANGRLLVGDDGGIHRSTNNGSSWNERNDGLGTIQFYAGLSSHPTDDVVFYGGTQDNGSNKRTNDSLEWTQVFGGDGGWTQVDPNDPDRVFVEFQGTANLYRSVNGGASFSWVGSGIDFSDRNCFLPPYVIDPSNSNRMFYGTHRVYRSTNGASSWSPISGDLSNGAGAIRTLALAPSDPNVLYAATNDGNVLISTNGGFNFTTIRSGVPGWPRTTREIFVHPTDALTAYLAVAAYGESQIQKTTDGGSSWTPLDTNLPDLPVNAVAVLPGTPDRLFAGTDAGLLYSPNGGTTWTRYGTGLPRAPIIDILLEPARNRVVLGTQGRGAWQAELTP